MIFSGTTVYGRKVHLGNWMSPRHTARSQWVYTFCGSEMKTWVNLDAPNGIQQPRGEWCKTCFRAMAWHMLVKAPMGSLPRLSSVYQETVTPSSVLQRDVELRDSGEVKTLRVV